MIIVEQALEYLQNKIIDCDILLEEFYREPFNFTFNDTVYLIVSSADWMNFCSESIFTYNFDPNTSYHNVINGDLGTYTPTRPVRFVTENFKTLKERLLETQYSIIYNRTKNIAYKVNINFEQKPITRTSITIGDEEFCPTQEQLEEIKKIFIEASDDKLTIVTKQ